MTKRAKYFFTGFIACVLYLAAFGVCCDAALKVPDNVPRDRVICFALYTVYNGTMKMTAQLYPLEESEPKTVRLEIMKDGAWEKLLVSDVVERGWVAHFRADGWDATKDYEYRLSHNDKAFYTGIIRRDPIEKDEIVVAAFTGNSIDKPHGGTLDKDDLVANVKKLNPDLLFFSGDQVYDHHKHYAAWLKFGRDFGDIIKDYPTITIPDDHDVGQANLWGAGGKKSESEMGWDGGYAQPVEYVMETQNAQTWHFPDAYDPTPVEQGIGVYYTTYRLGRVSFAIIEDRKFKTGPQGLVPGSGFRHDVITDPNYDPESLDVPGTTLLGERQLSFLSEWGKDWKGSDMKVVLSATIFANAAHVHGSPDARAYADYDSNGWPQTGRNKALKEIRKSFSFMLAGDQHLATLIHQGVDDWNDSGYSFSVPSIANFYLRWWDPLEPGANRAEGEPEYLGEFKDGFGNKMTMLAVANPDKAPSGDTLTTRAAGFGVARFNTKTREITLECWPRNVDIADPAAQQYPGWPRTLKQEDNYGRKAVAWLPELKVTGMENPVVQVVQESSGEVVYTLRINGTDFRPKVFSEGAYTVNVGDQDSGNMKSITGLNAEKENKESITVEF